MTTPRADRDIIRDHVERVGENHPPIDLDSADFPVTDLCAVRSRFAEVLEYMARVEMGVERNVLEFALPAGWDRGRSLFSGTGHLPAVQQVVRLLYYLTGAATEKSAMTAYQAISTVWVETGEVATKPTVVYAIKVHEPGHSEFYRSTGSASRRWCKPLAPWQLYLARIVRAQLRAHRSPHRRGACRLRLCDGEPRPWQPHLPRRLRHRPGRGASC